MRQGFTLRCLFPRSGFSRDTASVFPVAQGSSTRVKIRNPTCLICQKAREEQSALGRGALNEARLAALGHAVCQSFKIQVITRC